MTTRNFPRAIGLVGAAGSGKSEVAKILCRNHRYLREAFAEPLKDMLGGLGLSYEQLYGTEKQVPCAILGGKTPRYAML